VLFKSELDVQQSPLSGSNTRATVRTFRDFQRFMDGDDFSGVGDDGGGGKAVFEENEASLEYFHFLSCCFLEKEF